MAAKLLCFLVVLAMMAQQAQASMMLEKFEDFLANMNYDNFIILICFQFWGFMSPMLKGVLDVILKYIWDNGKIKINIDSTNTMEIGYAQALGFVGIGNFKQLSDTFMEIFPKILVNKIVSTSSKMPYGGVADELLKKLNINL